MKKILGLDLGTNSIGWALVDQDFEKKEGKILGMGSRIIPMTQDVLDNFGAGKPTKTQTAERTDYRSVRRLRERHLLRRERLHRVLNILGFLPKHYVSQIDFEKRFGQFLEGTEPKLAYNNKDFIFKKSFEEMLKDFKQHQPELLNRKNKKGEDAKIPYDWTIYYLRQKALLRKIGKEELAWIILNFNQKRGYYQLRGEEEEDNPNKLVEFRSLKVVDVKADGSYILTLSNNMEYRYESNENLFEWKDKERNFLVTTYLNDDGTAKKEENGNNKRSIYLLREGETASTKKKNGVSVENCCLKIVDVRKENDRNKKEEIWYSLTLENGWIYRRSSKIDLSDWKDKVRDFIVTTDLNNNGSIKTDKEGEVKRSFRSPKEDDWTLVKKKTENDLDGYIKKYEAKNGIKGTVGTYIYENLFQNPNQKIKGKLVRTIERKFYKEELKAILEKQIELQPELFSDDLYNDCVRELYRNNEAQQLVLSKRDFVHLFLDDIIFYQRPLKSKKSSIGNCSLEFRPTKDKNGNLVVDKDGKAVLKPLKAIPKSHPYYQEFRVWQWLYNLKIYRKDDETDITQEMINGIEEIEKLFEFLMSQKEVDHKAVLKHLLAPQGLKGKALNSEIAKYRWNYVYDSEKNESKKYPMNETGYEIMRRLEKVENTPSPSDFLETVDTKEVVNKKTNKKEVITLGTREQQLWHIIYSVKDKKEFEEKALKKFASKYGLNENSFVENFKNFPPFKSDYGRYSEKAIKKLLPLMRIGKYWNWNSIDNKTRARIDKIITGEYDEEIKDRVREKAINLTEENHFQGLQLWLAQYIVYGRHSEANVAGKWNSVDDLEGYLKGFKQHSLRNPIVEQVVTETLRVVKDIWKQYGKGAKDYFDEIHIELGREMKNPKGERERLTNIVSENENTNLRIKTILAELLNDSNIENVRPYSPTQQEVLKIYEDGVLNSGIEVPGYVKETIKKFNESDPKKRPSLAEINRYKLWLDQKYRSPYTGEVIPLTKLFTSEYEIEHVIPQSRYFDDSFSNKVICEASVNKLKDNQLGLEFIKNHHGEKVECGQGKTVEIFSESAYKNFIQKHYSQGKSRSKRNKLLMEEIPDKMIERQLNDTRYISKFISNVLSNIVRVEKGDDGINSKKIIPVNGKITGKLKQDWGLNDVWNSLILPRFERMNKLTNSEDFTSKNTSGKTIPTVPMKLSKSFQKKRIDHRHHALDALIIACATRGHVQYLSNENAKSQKFHLQRGLARKLRRFESVEISKMKKNDRGVWAKCEEKINKEVPKDFLKPWNTITEDTRSELEKVVVSFKQNLRVINKTTNRYESYKDENGNLRIGKDGKPKKDFISQTKGDSWAIRKPLHKETVYGNVELPRIKVPKGKILTATRQGNDLVSIFKDVKTKDKAEDIIEKITDSGIQKILTNYLESKGNNPEIAFSPEGIEDMNKNISQYNGGKSHQPVYKVRIFKETSEQFRLGQTKNKGDKYVTTAQGTNLFFAIYQVENGKRRFETIPLNIVIERQKQGLNSVPETNERDETLLFHLSPSDLVYVPTEDEKENINRIYFENLSNEQIKRLYNVNDFSDTCYFTPNRLAKAITAKEVDISFNKKKNKIIGSFDTKTASLDGIQIKDVCIKLKVDRLGNISKA